MKSPLKILPTIFVLLLAMVIGNIVFARSDAWATKASMPNAVHLPAAGAIGGKLYVAGGAPGGCPSSNALEVYDPATDSWTTKAPMTVSRGGHAAATINDRLYVVGGNSAGGMGFLSSLEVYTPTATPTPTPTPEPTPTPTPEPTPTPQVGPPTDKEQCKDGGWQTFNAPRAFRNQGDCIQFVNTGK